MCGGYAKLVCLRFDPCLIHPPEDGYCVEKIETLTACLLVAGGYKGWMPLQPEPSTVSGLV